MKKSYKTMGAVVATMALTSAISAPIVSSQSVNPGAQTYSVRNVQELDPLYMAIYEIINRVTSINTSLLQPDMSFRDIMDSLSFMEFVMSCEEEFKIEIPGEDVKYSWTIKEFYEYLEGRSVKIN